MQRQFNGVLPSPHDPRDHVHEAIRSAAPRDLPTSLDLRAKLQPVRDQGSTSTCAAQAAGCIKEYQERLEVDYQGYFSPQFVYNHRSNAPEPGMVGRNVMDILYKLGTPPEYMYPFGTTTEPSADTIRQAANMTIKEYARVETILGLKTALVADGPCYISFPTYNSGTRMWKPQPGDTSQGGHAMTVVGYDKNGFIIRNSWGDDWGDGGYCTYPYEDWGSHWEIWSTVDRANTVPIGTETKHCCMIV